MVGECQAKDDVCRVWFTSGRRPGDTGKDPNQSQTNLIATTTITTTEHATTLVCGVNAITELNTK